MLVVQRRNKIRGILLQQGSVKVADLVHEFDVSEETIRRDLNLLEQEGLIEKNYGGAILVDESLSEIPTILPIQQRKSQHFKEKDAIGKKAAQLVQEDQIVILDAGSTTWCVARHLKHAQSLTVITNGITVAEECSHIDDSSVFLIGGKLIKKSMSLVGPQAEIELKKYNADFVFLGASGISLRKGFTSSDIYEAEMKRAMIATGQKVVIVADHTKFRKQSLLSFGNFEEVDMLITSDLADDSILKEIEKLEVNIIVCATGGNSSH